MQETLSCPAGAQPNEALKRLFMRIQDGALFGVSGRGQQSILKDVEDVLREIHAVRCPGYTPQAAPFTPVMTTLGSWVRLPLPSLV